MLGAIIGLAVVVLLLLFFLTSAVKGAREDERGVVFRLGRLLDPPKGPGLFILIPIVDRMVKVDLRTITLNLPPQEVITKDNVPARVNAVAYFRIVDPQASVVAVENFMAATSQIAQTTLRSVLGQHLIDELLSERDKINSILQEITPERWGRRWRGRPRAGTWRSPSGRERAGSPGRTGGARGRVRPRPSAS